MPISQNTSIPFLSTVLEHVRGHVEERLRTHLRKRCKVGDRKAGYARFGNRVFYGQYGLYIP